MSITVQVDEVFWGFCNYLIDINECNDGDANCSQICTNTIGSYYCSCEIGFYNLTVDGRNCSGLDIHIVLLCICFQMSMSVIIIMVVALKHAIIQLEIITVNVIMDIISLQTALQIVQVYDLIKKYWWY